MELHCKICGEEAYTKEKGSSVILCSKKCQTIYNWTLKVANNNPMYQNKDEFISQYFQKPQIPFEFDPNP